MISNVSNRNGRRRLRASRNGQLKSDSDKILDCLKQIEKYQSVQIRGSYPPVPDVPKMKCRRDKVYTFPQAYQNSQIVTSTTVDTSGGFLIEFGNISNAGAFSQIFDEFRIMQVTAVFTPRYVDYNGGAPLYTVFDYNDSTPLGSVPLEEQYESLEITQAGQVVERTLTPNVPMYIYTAPGVSGYARSPFGTWISCANTGANYYGLKYYIPLGTVVQTIDVSIRIILQCRYLR